MANLDNLREDFPLVANSKISYLDSAATSQKPQVVIDKLEEFYKLHNANIHRGAYSLSIEATRLYDEARHKVAKFINATKDEDIIFTKNATESLNLVAYSYGLENINEGDEVCISIMEHHSNLVPWQKVVKAKNAKLTYMYIDDDFQIPDEEIESKINSNTKIVSITYVSNVLGTINDVEKIIKKAHKVGAVAIVDASQAVMHMPIDVQKLDADFIFFSGHKMYATLGVGVLYGKYNLLDKMTPFLMGGDMIEYVNEQDTTFAELPSKFEAGTQNIGGAVALGYAIDYINEIGFNKIDELEEAVTNYARDELAKLDFIEMYFTKDEKKHKSVISFNVKGVHPHDVASVLDSKNVCVRSGNHCAQPLMKFLGIDSTCRASFAFYNNKHDVDMLIEALKECYNMFKKYIK